MIYNISLLLLYYRIVIIEKAAEGLFTEPLPGLSIEDGKKDKNSFL